MLSDISLASDWDTFNPSRQFKGSGRWKIHPEEYTKIAKMYANGSSHKEIAKFYQVTKKTIATILGKLSITSRGRRLYKIKDDYFKKIDSCDKAYFLGFMYADGSVEQNKRIAKITLAEPDKYILEIFKQLVYENEKPDLYTDFFDWKGTEGRRQKKYVLKFYSKTFCSNLINHGCIPNKSLVVKFPNHLLDNQFIWHFIRGLFDADGCFFRVKDRTNRNAVWEVLSSDELCKGLQAFLLTNGIKANISKRGNISSVRVCSREDLLYVCENMYNNCGKFFLQRKYNKFLEFKTFLLQKL